MKDYRDLEVWNQAMLLAEAVYRATASLPSSEQFGLTSQARRSAVSIAANIAEGNGRARRTEYAHFVSIARGSQTELSTILELIGRVYPALDLTHEKELANRVGRMLTGLRSALLKESA